MVYSGGCQCGQIRYEVRSQPLTIYACHCTECQRQSGSAFGMSMPVLRSSLVILKGEPKTWSRETDGGRTVICHFCSVCGTRLFHQPSRNPAIVNIKPGTLDDTSWLQSIGNLWTQRAQPWVTLNDEMLNYPGQPTPEEFEQLYATFSQTRLTSDPL